MSRMQWEFNKKTHGRHLDNVAHVVSAQYMSAEDTVLIVIVMIVTVIS